MAENLKTSRFADGSGIQQAVTPESWADLPGDAKAYCFYEEEGISTDTYGALYTWSAASNGEESNMDESRQVQGACPDGWHLPGENEWKQLERQMGMSELYCDG